MVKTEGVWFVDYGIQGLGAEGLGFQELRISGPSDSS